MKIVCEKCGSKYSVDDSKVQNKSFKITCKNCDNKIIIDNTKKDEDLSSTDPFDSQTNWDDDMPSNMGEDMEFDDQATKIMSYEDAMKMEEEKNSNNDSFNQQSEQMDFDDEATKIMSSSAAASLNATAAMESNMVEEDWYVHINGQQVGPLSLSQLQNKIKQDNLNETTNVWKTGMADWSMIKNIPQLAKYIVVSTPPIDPFGGVDNNLAAFGNDSLIDDNDAESLFNDKQQQSNASSFSGNNSSSDPFSSNSNSNSNGFGAGLDLKSLIDEEDLDEDEEDASSKSKVIDFRDIQGSNNKKIVVQHASFNASTKTSSGGNKGLIITLVAIIFVAVAGIGVYFAFLKDKPQIVKKEKLTKVLLSSTPTNALIKLNGELKGKTGGDLIEVKPGSYQVKIIKDGYKITEDIVVIKDTDFIKKYELVAEPKEITIKTGIVEADITIGNEKLKTNPNGEVTLKILPSSNIAIKVEKDGNVKISTLINVSLDGDKEFDLSALASDDNKKTVVADNTNNNAKTSKRVKTNKTNKKVKKVKEVKEVKTTKKDDLDDLFNDKPKKTVVVASNLPKTLSQNQVLPVIKGIYPKVKTCGKNAGVTGKVMVKFKINGTGSVSGIVVGDTGGTAKNCIYSKVRSMRFPKFSGASIPVTFPFKM
jgi:DNA-directed RNA polymerase subunit RPC12/RpoP